MSWPQSVDRSQLRVEYFRGPGPGGQKRNKTSNACRITHEPTGLVGKATESTRQSMNRRVAFKRLCQKLLPIMVAAATEEAFPEAARPQGRVRSYHEPRGTVKDHRTGRTYNYSAVLDGGLDEILDDLVREVVE